MFIYHPTDHTTYIDSMLKHRKWDDFALVVKVGQISYNEIQKFQIPVRFAKEIEYRLISQVYDPICQANKSPKWSSRLNCQTFTRSCIEHLGIEFPSEVDMISDCIPTMMNIY